MEMEAPVGIEPVATPSRLRRRTLEEWKGIVERWAGSGESVAAFCRREGVNVCQFFNWRKRLSAGPASVRAAGTESGDRLGGFVEAIVVGGSPGQRYRAGQPVVSAGARLEIALANGRRISLEGAVDFELLERLVRLLEAI